MPRDPTTSWPSAYKRLSPFHCSGGGPKINLSETSPPGAGGGVSCGGGRYVLKPQTTVLAPAVGVDLQSFVNSDGCAEMNSRSVPRKHRATTGVLRPCKNPSDFSLEIALWWGLLVNLPALGVHRQLEARNPSFLV